MGSHQSHTALRSLFVVLGVGAAATKKSSLFVPTLPRELPVHSRQVLMMSLSFTMSGSQGFFADPLGATGTGATVAPRCGS